VPASGPPRRAWGSWGWHRLADEWAARVVAAAGVRPGELVLDIGAGEGALTAHLLRAGARVVAVEWHPGRAAKLSHRFSGITVVRADAASMLPTVGAVALGALRTGRLGQGDTVLITAGAGAIGHLAVQLARQQGAGTVIATAGSPGKLAFLKELGADVAVDHTEPGWSDQVRLAAPGGVDVILEAVGGEMLHKSIGLLAPFGRVVVYGAAAGDLTSIPVTSLFPLKTVSGFSLLAWRAADPEQARADIAGLTGLLETGQLHIAATALPLAEAVQAHRLLEDRTVIGRLILRP